MSELNQCSAMLMVNSIPGIEGKTYLELGVGARRTFDGVNAGTKVGVDLGGEGPDVYYMSTDEFFLGPGVDMTFDAVYIDACHDYPHPLLDFNNVATRLNPKGLIFLHDMNPPDELRATPEHCSDSFKLLAGLIQRGLDIAVLDQDLGMTVVFNARPVKPESSWATLTYADFLNLDLPIVDASTMQERVARYVSS